MSNETPKQLGFMMPAEWEKHSAVWLAWPYDITTFTQGIESAEKTFCEIIKALKGSEKIELIVLDSPMQARAENLLKNFEIDLANVNFHQVEFTDVWTRDYGPFFIINRERNELGFVKWLYNAYGKSEHPYFTALLKDNEVFNIIKPSGKKFTADMVLEGGAIEVNGQGTILTTEQCLLNKNRNPNLNKKQVELYLSDNLGINKIIWLKRGLVNDHTDGHIDDIARFVAPDKIICAFEDDTNDENYEILAENFQDLKKATDQNGNPFDIIKLPLPHMRYEVGHSLHSTGLEESTGQITEAEKATVSYCNFYIGNTVVLVPTFADPNDEKALQIIQSCFPERKVIGVDCREIIYGGGSIHCMTQQQPAI